MKLTPEDIRKLAKITLQSKPAGLSCEDWIHMVGEYVEAQKQGKALTEQHQQVARHAAECPSCDEEMQTLSELLDEEE